MHERSLAGQVGGDEREDLQGLRNEGSFAIHVDLEIAELVVGGEHVADSKIIACDLADGAVALGVLVAA